MVHKENFVVAIKSNGKILREFGDIIYLPFGSEYSILLKNLNSVSAVVDVDVDGSEVGKGIIVRPNSTSELYGFLEGYTVKNRFKFIRKTEEISNYRGDKIDDGIIRVEYKFEKQYQSSSNIVWYYPDGVRNPTFDSSTYYFSTYCVNNDAGITVKGSDVRQDFQIGYTNDLEDISYVISLTLKGTDKDCVEVRKPITTKSKLKCNTCGRASDSSAQFCSNCGTRLI